MTTSRPRPPASDFAVPRSGADGRLPAKREVPMATVHYRARFDSRLPNLEELKARIQERTGLAVALGKDSIDVSHEFPDIGRVREAGSLECDEAGDSDLDIMVGSLGVRVD